MVTMIVSPFCLCALCNDKEDVAWVVRHHDDDGDGDVALVQQHLLGVSTITITNITTTISLIIVIIMYSTCLE